MRKFLIVGFVTLASLCAAPAMATSVDLTMTNQGLNNGILGNAYIGPYTVETTGTTNTFQVICDDFTADTDFNESWVASVTNFSNLTGKFGTDNPTYDEVGFLAEALFNFSASTPCEIASCAGANSAADIQYALWEVFGSPSAFATLAAGSADALNAAAWLNLAAHQTYNIPGEFSDLVIYTPTACINGPGCNPTTNANLPQEFIGRTAVPEPGTLLLLGIGMLAIVFYGRRKLVHGDMAI